MHSIREVRWMIAGDTGEPVDLVITGRLVRPCCKARRKDVEKNPAESVAMVNAAGSGDTAGPGAEDDKPNTLGGHKHGGG